MNETRRLLALVWLLIITRNSGQSTGVDFRYTGQVPIIWNAISTSELSTSADLGDCMCDMTSGTCDANCCCDPDCLPLTVQFFDTCKLASPLSQVFKYCSSSLLKVNRGNYALLAGNSLSCVFYTNKNAKSNAYLNFPGVVPNDAAFTQLSNSFTFQYALSQRKPLTSDNLPFTVDSVYKVSTPVYAFFSSGSSSNLGLYTLPDSLDDGSCNDFASVNMLTSRTSSCTRTFRSVSTGCSAGPTSPLDPKYYLQGISFPANPSSTTGPNFQFRNFYCGPGNQFCCLGSGNMSACQTASDFSSLVSNPAALTIPAPSFDGTTCNDVLIGLNVTFKFSFVGSSFAITGATVDVYYGSFSSNSVTQTFSVNFQADSPTKFPYTRSGNAGYNIGLPVLAGSLQNNGQFQGINWSPNSHYGLTIMSQRPDNGQCTSNTQSDIPFRVPVRFGQDAVSGCVLKLSMQDLASNCPLIRQRVYQHQMGSTNALITHLGILGNSSVQNLNQWVRVNGLKTIPVTLTGSNTDAGSQSGQCNNILTEMNIQILTMTLGSVSNPQYAIVGARVNFVAGSFQYRCALPTCKDSATTQKFAIRSTVTFIPASNDGYNQVASGLQSIKIPSDVWYPFWYQQVNSASRSQDGISIVSALLLIFFTIILQ